MHSPAGLAWRALLVVAANSAQPLLVDLARLHGAAGPSCCFFVLPAYASMLLVGGVTCGEKSQLTTSHWRRAASICLVDVAHQILEKAGLVHAGSALYLIAASFSTVWTALLSLLVLNKRMNQTQWVGVLLVTLGFCLRVAQVGPPAQGNDELLGVLLITTAQILHGLAFVLNEKYMNDEEAAIEGPQLVFMCGFINTVGLLCWTGVWTAPRWGALVTNARKQRGGSSAVIAGCFVGLTVCSLLRSSVLWVLLKHLGAVSAGVLKAARMAVVTALTHLLFCSQQPSQCLTPLKAVAASVVSFGGKKRRNKNTTFEEMSASHKPFVTKYKQHPTSCSTYDSLVMFNFDKSNQQHNLINAL